MWGTNGRKNLIHLAAAALLSIFIIAANFAMVSAEELREADSVGNTEITVNGNSSSREIFRGSGEEDTSDYKEIRTIADLYGIRNDLSGKYILMNDIDMSSTDGGDYDIDGCGWKPIGGENSRFAGVLDGNGHKLYNLTFKGDKYSYVGLFGSTDGAQIRNLGIENVSIKCSGNYIGSIVGFNRSKIDSCYVRGVIQQTEGSSAPYIGGIVGYKWSGIISDCYSFVTVSSKSSNIGGICGISDSDIYRCYSINPVQYTDEQGSLKPGAMISHNNYTKSTNCYYLSVPGEERTDPNAQGLSSGMMKTRSSFTGFDFDKVWYMDPHAPNNNYPQLRSCPQDRITSIEIENKPEKLEYLTIDENIDLTGGTFKIRYEDGTVAENVKMDEAAVDYSFLPAGTQTVTIEYGGKTTSFDITVKKAPASINGTKEYEKYVDEVFSPDITTDSDGVPAYIYDPGEGKKVIRLSDGYIECLIGGEAVVKCTVPETDKYLSASEEIKITVKKLTPAIKGDTEFEKKVKEVFKPGLTTDSDGELKYEYTPVEVGNNMVKVDKDQITCLAGGEAVIKASVSETDRYLPASVEIRVKINKSTPTIWGTDKYEKSVDDKFELDITTDSDGVIEYLPVNGYGSELGLKGNYDDHYFMSDKILEITGNEVLCLAEGDAVIGVFLPETDMYEPAVALIVVSIEDDGNDDNGEDEGNDDNGGKDDKKDTDNPDDGDDEYEDGEDKVKYYTVTFDSRGGSEVAKQKIEQGDYAEKPANPIKEGYIFVGWYSDKDCKTRWDFSSNLVYNNMTLFARWETSYEKAREEAVIYNGDVVFYNGIRYYMSGTKVNMSDLFYDASEVSSSDKGIAKVSKKGVVSFKKDGQVTLTSDTGKSILIRVFGKKPLSATIKVGETYTIPDEVMIETFGDLRYSNASKVAVSDDGKLTALSNGTVKIKYTQSGKTRVVLKLKITK